jgi:hypothetical protein
MKFAAVFSVLLATSAAAAIPTPERPVTDPKSIASPSDPQAVPVPIDDLVFSRGVFDSTWSADGRQLFISTNLTGRYNIWRMDTAGSWPVQLTQSDETRAASPSRRTGARSSTRRTRAGTSIPTSMRFRPAGAGPGT